MGYKRLEMIFANTGGTRATISVYDPRPDLEGQEVKTAMEDIIAKEVFTSTNGDLSGINGARIVERDVQDLDVT